MRFDRHDLIYRLRQTLFFSIFFVRRRRRRRRCRRRHRCRRRRRRRRRRRGRRRGRGRGRRSSVVGKITEQMDGSVFGRGQSLFAKSDLQN